jgi:hypothetical protein
MLGAKGPALLALTVCAGLVVFILIRMNAPLVIWKDPPLYPDAQNVRVADFGEDGIREREGLSGDVLIMKVITYTVEASRADVVSFYRIAFSSSGMAPSDWGRIDPAAKDLNYSWTTSGRPPSVYFLDLVTREVNSHSLEVEIGVSMFPGY